MTTALTPEAAAVAVPAAVRPGDSLRRALVVRARFVPGAPVAAVRVVLPGGARRERIPGQAFVAGRMLAEGSRRRDWRQIGDDFEAKGMILTTAGTFESESVAVDALAGDWETALEWAAELTLEPAFPDDRCAWVRRQTAAELESLGDQPEVRTAWGFIEQLYAPHPRGRRLQGDAESLTRLRSEDCAAFHAASLARGAIVAVTGEIDEDAVAARAAELFAGAVGSGGPEPEPPPPAAEASRREVALQGTDQAHLYLGHLTVPRKHPDAAALELAAVVLGAGSGLTGRIPTRIREREGLAYTAYAQTMAGAGLDPGRLVAYVGTSPATVAQAERGAIEEIARFLDEGPSEDEVEEARAYLLGREPFRRETARQWAEILAETEFYGMPLDDPAWREAELRRPDRAATLAAARRHLHPEKIRVTVGLPEGSETAADG